MTPAASAVATPGGRGFARLGLVAGAIFLWILPLDHVAATRSLSLALALVAALAIWLAAGRRPPPLLPTFGIWLAAALLSLISSVDQSASVNAIYGEVIRAFLVFFVFHTLTRHLPALRAWALASALSALTLTAFAIGSFVIHGQWQPGYLPALGDFATSALTMLPVLFTWLVLSWSDRSARALMLAAIAGLLVSGYLTQSRGFWLALMAGAIVAAAMVALRRRRIGRNVVLALAAICAVALGFASHVAAQRGLKVVDVSARTAIYMPVAKKILTNPLTGTGYGHETDRDWYRLAPGMPPEIFHAHNIVLSYLDQMGPLGLLALAAIFGMPVPLLGRCGNDGAAVIVGTGGLALLFMVFLKNNLDFFFWNQNLWLFFAHLGIALGQMARLDEAPGKL